MHILQVGKYLPPVTGGIETVVYELSSGLSGHRDVQVSCLVSNTEPKTVYETVSDNFRVVRAARYGTLASTPLSFSFRREGRKIGADLLHFHLPNPLATAAFHDVDKPFVVTYHCDIVRYKTLLKIYEPAMNRFLSKASRILVSSPQLIANSAILRRFKEKCVVIPFSVDPAHLALTPEREEVVKEIRAEHGDRIVLFVGRLVSYKGLPDLISAMGEVEGKLVIVGTGPESVKREEMIESQGLSSKVTLVGHVPQNELGAYYHAADVVALTSINESEAFGVCLIEGLACGKPLVTTRLNTGVSLVNADGITGFQVAVGDRAAIAQKLNLLLSDRNLNQEFSHNALGHFQNNFARDTMTDAHLRIYREILGR